MSDQNLPPDPEPEAEPTVEELLLARIDSYARQFDQELELLSRVTSQLTPGRAEACGSLISMMRVMVAELAERAHGRPMDEPGQ